MSVPRPTLEQLQRWMQAVITSPGGIAAGAATAAAQAEIDVAPDELETVIGRSRQLTSEERLSIYQGAYFARLLECLRDMFPMTVRLLGEEAFNDLALAYLQHFPPRTYTLNRLGDRFAEFLAMTRPQDESAEFADFVTDLVRLEWEISEVFDGPGLEEAAGLPAKVLLPSQDKAAPQLPVEGEEGPSELRLRTAPCLRLLRFGYPLNDAYTALRARQQPALPSPKESYLALSRRSYIVQRHSLSRAEFLTLDALRQGETIAAALDAGLQALDNPPDDQAAEEVVHAWFRSWTEDGFFDLSGSQHG